MLRLHWTAVNNLDIHKVLHKKDSDLCCLGVKPLLHLDGGLLGDGLLLDSRDFHEYKWNIKL